MAKGNAESLYDILEFARTRQLHGMMTIEHFQGGKVEEGEVFFQAGQPLQARAGYLNGQDALNWLMRWHNITFMIETGESLQSVASTNAGNRTHTTASSAYITPRGIAATEPSSAQMHENVRGSIFTNTSTRGIDALVPQKRGIEREVLALPLTRRQRCIYFLVDGHRSVADLARCTGKNTQEIGLILSELQEQGLVAV